MRALAVVRHAPLFVLLLAAGLTCRDGAPTGPGLPGRGALDVAPLFHVVPEGAPDIELARVRALLIGDGRDGKDTATAEAPFQGDSAVLRFDVLVAAPSQLFALEVEAIDAAGVVVYRGTDTVRVAPGRTAARGAPLLRYVAPDTAVTTLVLAPRDTIIEAGDTLRMGAAGFGADSAAFPDVRVGWTSRDKLAATISSTGLIEAQLLERATWIVGRTMSGAMDSIKVHVRGGIAAVVISPDSAATLIGSTIAMYAEARDAAGTSLAGAGREVVWTTLDPQIVSLSPMEEIPPPAASRGPLEGEGAGSSTSPVVRTGIGTSGIASTAVTGLAEGVGRIVAQAGGRADTAWVRVQSNAGIVVRTEIRPKLDTLASLGDTLQLLAASYDAQDALAAGRYTWLVRDPQIASVSPLGTVVARANGQTWVIVQEDGGTTDSASVVVMQRVASVSVFPFTARVTLGGAVTFTAAPVDGRGQPVPSSRPIVWDTESRVLAQIDGAGVATGTGVGEESIFASIDGVVGRALLRVTSPVAFVAIAPDTITLTALGASAQWTATAYDSAGAAVSAPVVWETDGTVLETTAQDGAVLTAAARANGTTMLRARVHGIDAAVPVRVQQTLASVLVAPDPVTIGVGGAAQLVPRALDANGQPIAGFPLTGVAWTVAQSGIATVTGGFVRGASIGSTTVTATAGAVTSPPVRIDVTDAVPPAIAFGHDTIVVGFADSVDIPLHLNRPSSGSPVDVHVASSDPAVSVTPSVVRFDPTVTTRSVRVRGHAVATATLTATDSLTGYAPAIAVIAAQPGAALEALDLALNANDETVVRVLLSEPAPAGGVHLKFDDGQTGIVAVSPAPVLIPAGHLAADVIVRGLRAGEAMLVPTGPGVRGTPSRIVVSDAVLAFTRARPDSGCWQCERSESASPDATGTPGVLPPASASRTPVRPVLGVSAMPSGEVVLVGAGQYVDDGFSEASFGEALGVRTPQPMQRPLRVSIAVGNPDVVKADKEIVIGAGGTEARLGVAGLRVGEATLTASAPGWTQATQPVIVTTPHLELCCEGDRLAGTLEHLSVTVTDSAGIAHPRITSLVTHASSSDPSVVTVLDTAPVIRIDQSSNWDLRIKAIAPGTAWIRVRAGGHRPDSIPVRVLGSTFHLFATPAIGAEQRDDYAVYISLPAAAQTERIFSVQSSAPAVLSVPASVTVPAGWSYAYVPIEGRSPGTATLTVDSPETGAVQQTIVVTSPRLVIQSNSDTVAVNGTASFVVYTTDSLGTPHATTTRVIARVRSRDDTILITDPDTLIIDPGQSSVVGMMRGIALGSTRVRAQASSHLEDSTGIVTVVGSRLRVNSGQTRRTVGAGQRQASPDHVQIPEPQAADVQLSIAGARHTQAPASLTIPAGNWSAELSIAGLTIGTDTLIVTAAGYEPDTLYYDVTPPRLLDAQTLPSTIALGSPPYEVRVRPGDAAGEPHIAESGVTVRIRSTDPAVLSVDSTWIHIDPGTTLSTSAAVTFAGLGSAALIFEDSAGIYAPDTSLQVLVTAPPLALGASSTSVGLRQQTEDYDQWVTLPMPAGSDVTVQLTTSDPRVATVPASVVIPAGQSMATFRITGGDVLGTVQLRAQADGHHPATATIEVGRPGFSLSLQRWGYTVDTPQPVTVWATDHRGTFRTVTEDIVVRLESANPLAAQPDSATVTILAGTRGAGEQGNGAVLVPRGVGTTVLSATDARTATWAYRRAESDTIEVRRPEISLGYEELVLGIGQSINNGVWIAGTVAGDRVVRLQRSAPTVADAPDSVVVQRLQGYAALQVTGRVPGVDTLIATIPGYVPDSTIIRVDSGRVELLNNQGYPLAAVRVGQSVMVRLQVRGPDDGYGGPVAAATTWTLSSDAGLSITADAAGQSPIGSITVAAGQTWSPWFYVHGAAAGTSSVRAESPDYRSLDRAVRVDP